MPSTHGLPVVVQETFDTNGGTPRRGSVTPSEEVLPLGRQSGMANPVSRRLDPALVSTCVM